MDIVRPVLIDKVERDHWQPDEAFVRRRIVVGITLAVGATLLGCRSPYDRAVGLLPADLRAGSNLDIGSLLSGPLHLGHPAWRHAAAPDHHTHRGGLLLAALFVLGAFVIRTIPALRASLRTSSATRGWEIFGSFW
jgi:hypothetical protein